jgi:hypothetical protein
VRVVSRAEWGAAPARSVTRLDPSRVVAFVLHHTTGSYGGMRTVRSIQSFHQDSRGWADIGYNFLVSPDGTVFEGRGWDRVGAHAKDRNSTSIGVAYIGDGRQPVSDAAKRAILELAAEADRRFAGLRRVGHRDVGSTVCPGDVLYGWWSAGPSLPAAPTFVDARESIVCPPSGVPTPAAGQVSSERISEPPRGTPDVRDGWRRHMARMGWLRRD